MNNPITQAMRYLRREYPFLTAAGAVGFGVGALTGLFAVGALGLVPVLVWGTTMGLVFLGISSIGGEPGRPGKNTLTLNGLNLVGDRRDLASIDMTQRLIDAYTNRMQHLPELPSRVLNRIKAHIDDIQHHLARVRAYDINGRLVTSFPFTRKMISAAGKETQQVVAECNELPATETTSGKHMPAKFRDRGDAATNSGPQPGDTTPDGTIFAGISPDTGKPIYTTPADAPLMLSFNEATGYARKLNREKYLGHEDWRLPTKNELNVLFNSCAVIGGSNASGSDPTGWHRSGTQFHKWWDAWDKRLNGYQSIDFGKDYPSSVRCVR